MSIELPKPRVWIELNNCVPVSGTELCADLPTLLIIGEEPLPNDHIEKIEGRLNNIPFICFENTCEIPLRSTDEYGENIEFWAESSFGDSTSHYQGRIRVIDRLSEIPFNSGWQIDIVSENEGFNTLTGCEEIWQ